MSQTMSPCWSWMGLVCATLLAACSGSSTPTGTTDTRPPLTREELLDPATCGKCHQKHYAEWSGSMHAYASTDPVFRAMNARGQKETNGALGDFCIKCHAPMAVREGATQDGLNLDSDAGGVPEKLQGITCYFCHNVTDVTDTHNNPLVLANDTTMRGGIKNPLTYYAHPSEYSTLHDSHQFKSSNLCGACHDIVVPGHFAGAKTDAGAPTDVPLEQTFTEWKGSVFAIPTAPGANTCGGCHFKKEFGVPIANPPDGTRMPSEKERHAHTFPAVDTALVPFPENDADGAIRADQMAKVTDLLNTELRIQICAGQPGKPIEVTLENLGAGHYFPSGASQDRRLWVELHAYRQGKEVYTSGAVPPGTAATAVPGTWLLRDETLKADGQTPAHMFWDVAKIKRETIRVSTLDNVSANALLHQYADSLPVLGVDDVKVKVWLEPIGLDVIDDMRALGYLDPSLRASVPRFLLRLPSAIADAGADPVSLEWTAAAAQAGTDGFCVENTIPRLALPAP